MESKFGAKDKFTFFEKGDVNGHDTRDVYSFLKSTLSDDDGNSDISWNFEKFLVDHEGNPNARFSPDKNPLDMTDYIEHLLEKANQ